MLSYLSNFESVFGPLRLLRYLTVRMMLATVTAVLIGFVIGPWLIRRFRTLKLGQNFADGRNPQDKGDSARHGIPKHASISSLRKIAKQGGRKGQLAHWQANMRSGRNK